MGFLGVYRAVYDYTPQAEEELQIAEGDLLFVLKKNTDDDWWKAKKKATAEEDDEPMGLIPNNYVEEAKPIGRARALYDYTRQTEEELSFSEDASLLVFDTSDPDWILVGLDGDYGFVPSNYIEIPGEDEPDDIPGLPAPAPPALPARPAEPTVESAPEVGPRSPAAPVAATGPAAALAAAMTGRTTSKPSVSFADELTSHKPPALPRREHASPEPPEGPEEEEPASPPLPSRPVPPLQPRDPPARSKSPPMPIRATSGDNYDTVNPSPLSPGGFRLYNISEMVSVMGKKKKMPTTLGVNLATGLIMIAPEKAHDGPTQEWTGDRMTHYSREGKHVFLELVKPSKSIDFHAGAKDTAEEIVGALGELAGAIKAEGLREVIAATKGSGQKKGVVLYDFAAQGEDEVSVEVDDEVIVLDDRLSEEWWKVRRLRNGKEGVVPSTYIEVTGTLLSAWSFGINSGRSTADQSQVDEKRLFKEVLKTSREPERGSGHENGHQGSPSPSSSRSKPDPLKVRTWTDRSKSFSVEAQFLGFKDGKINLHKMNGVKIAVPVSKISAEDLDYVEKVIGMSIQGGPSNKEKRIAIKSPTESSRPKIGASIEPRKPDYDWFQFFLSCDVALGLCDRYAQAFVKDSIDESVLPDVDSSILRNLGLREGDIIKVMRHLDAKFGRTKSKDGEISEGGLFTGPGGALKNNTRKGRPSPGTHTNDVVDPNAFKDGDGQESRKASPAADRSASPAQAKKLTGGFDDDAWHVKPAKSQPQAEPEKPGLRVGEAKPETQPPAQQQQQQQLTATMKELSVLSQPLEPMKAVPPASAADASSSETKIHVSRPPTQLPSAPTSLFNPAASLSTPPAAQARARPAPTSGTPTSGGLVVPPPQRPLSAPQVSGTSRFSAPGILPQATGINTQIAPPGQSLNEITQTRMQQQLMEQQQQIQLLQAQQQAQQEAHQQAQQRANLLVSQPTGLIGPRMTGMAQQAPFNPQQSVVRPTPQMTGIAPQPTGIPGHFSVTGPANSFLSTPLEPQRTTMPINQAPPQPPAQAGIQSGLSPFGPGLHQSLLQPLTVQKTGPPPPVRFGVQNEPQKLAYQSTGRKANLSQATPDNPFGF